MIGQMGHDSQDRIAGAGQYRQFNWTGQPVHVSLDKTEKRVWPEHDNKERAARVGQPGQENLERIRCGRTDRTVQSGQDSWDISA
jgi:hypothetical protein